MKKNILLLLIVATLASHAHAQCDKEISTNPFNPFNDEFLPLMNEWFESDDPSTPLYTVNSFVNSAINWYPGNGIQLDLNEGWQHDFGNANNYSMTNPFSNNHNQTHLWLPSSNENDRDFRWEDGWELLWMNIGKSPNGDPYSAPSQGTYFAHGNQNATNGNYAVTPDAINPSNIPYFVLYNRYRGVIRLFANVWQGGSTGTQGQEWAVTMKYTTDDFLDQNISGLFRHASSIDRPLGEPTEHTQIIGPRIQTINQSNWAVAEFPMAFDPCICMKEKDPLVSKNPGRIEFLFETIETTDIDLYSRTIEVESAITESNLNEDYLNLSNLELNTYHPGSATYKRMDDLFDKYKIQLDNYNQELADYNSARNNATKDLIDLGKDLITSGLNLSIPAGQIFKDVIEEDGIFTGADDLNKITNNTIKGLLGIGVDYAAMEVFGKNNPTQPTKPTAPTASFAETKYKGDLTRSYYQNTAPLLIPGGINQNFDPSNIDPSLPSGNVHLGYGITQPYPSVFPAYNKLMGQAALMKYPNILLEYNKTYANMSDDGIDYAVPGFDFKLKFNDPVELAINRSLDFDLTRTNTFFNIEVVLELNGLLGFVPMYTSDNSGNMHITHEFAQFPQFNQQTVQINSKWVGLDELNQMVFTYNVGTALYIFDANAIYPFTNFTDFFEDFDNGYVVKSIKMKVVHDFYFNTVGYLGEKVNTTQIQTYLIYDSDSGVNHTDVDLDGSMDPLPSGTFDEYIPGLITIGDEDITLSHPYVNEVVGNEIFISAQKVLITGELEIPGGYTLVIQALEEIKMVPALTSLNPKIHLKIKKDFYDTPVFEYADNAEVYNFCNNSSAYQANTASKALKAQIAEQMEEAEAQNLQIPEKGNTSIAIYPNPASSTLTIQSQGNSIDRLTIFDAATRPVIQKTPNGSNLFQLDIHNLSPGVYIIRADCGGEVLTEKLVVAK